MENFQDSRLAISTQTHLTVRGNIEGQFPQQIVKNRKRKKRKRGVKLVKEREHKVHNHKALITSGNKNQTPRISNSNFRSSKRRITTFSLTAGK